MAPVKMLAQAGKYTKPSAFTCSAKCALLLAYPSPAEPREDGISVISVTRIRFDAAKDLVVRLKHGVSLEEAKEIFDQAYVVDAKK